jgi:hypothetical protein
MAAAFLGHAIQIMQSCASFGSSLVKIARSSFADFANATAQSKGATRASHARSAGASANSARKCAGGFMASTRIPGLSPSFRGKGVPE